MDNIHTCRVFQSRGPCDQGDVGAAVTGGFGKGVASFTRTIIGDKTDRVDGFTRWTRSNKHLGTSQIGLNVQYVKCSSHDGFGFGQATIAFVAAGQIAFPAFNDGPTTFAHGGKICLGAWVFIHMHIRRWSY